MSAFGTKKIYTKSTQISRLVEDEMLPDTMRAGMLKAILSNQNVADTLLDNVVDSGVHSFERMYQYAKAGHYTHGLPNVTYSTNTEGQDLIKAAIDSELGLAVTLEYGFRGPSNTLHAGWKHANEVYGYDEQANELTVLTAQIGHTVYLDNIVPTYIDDATGVVRSDYQVVGRMPGTGYTPERKTADSIGELDSNFEYATLPAGDHEFILIRYVWEDPGFEDLQRGEVLHEIVEYSRALTYFQAKYTEDVSGEIGYWVYDPISGNHPDLDALVYFNYLAPGTYFPFVPFRRAQENLTDASLIGTPEYDTSEKLLKYIGVDFATMGESINESDEIADVHQAVMLMAVPADTEDPNEIEYLFRHFKNAAQELPTSRPADPFEHTGRSYNTGKLTRKTAMTVADGGLEIELIFDDIRIRHRAGNIGTVGTYTSSLVAGEVVDAFDATNTWDSDTQQIHYRKQVTAGIYEEVTVRNLHSTYHIGVYDRTAGQYDNDKLLVPLDHNIAAQMPLQKREVLFYRSLHLVFNAISVTKLKFYQRNAFAVVLAIAAIIVIVISVGTLTGPVTAAYTTALATGATVTGAVIAATYVALQVVFFMLLNAAIYTGLARLALKVVAPEHAIVIALVAAIVVTVMEMKGAGESIWAEALMATSTSLTVATNREIRSDMKHLSWEQAEFEQLVLDKWAELEEAEKALNTTQQLLDPLWLEGMIPYSIPHESPDDYYNRTVHAGNVGPMSYEIVSSFVDISLTLPTLQDSVGVL